MDWREVPRSTSVPSGNGGDQVSCHSPVTSPVRGPWISSRRLITVIFGAFVLPAVS